MIFFDKLFQKFRWHHITELGSDADSHKEMPASIPKLYALLKHHCQMPLKTCLQALKNQPNNQITQAQHYLNQQLKNSSLEPSALFDGIVLQLCLNSCQGNDRENHSLIIRGRKVLGSVKDPDLELVSIFEIYSSPQNLNHWIKGEEASQLKTKSYKRLLIFVERKFDAEELEEYLNIHCPNSEHVTFAFVAKSASYIKSVEAHFAAKDDRTYNFPGLPEDYLSNYSLKINSLVRCSYFVGDCVADGIVQQARDSERPFVEYFSESIALSIEDSFYTLLRLLRGSDLFLHDQSFDGVVYMADDASRYLLCHLYIIAKRYAFNDVYLSFEGKKQDVFTSQLANVSDQFFRIGQAGSETSSQVTDFLPPRSFFSSIFGPIRPVVDFSARYGDLENASYAASYNRVRNGAKGMHEVLERISAQAIDDFLGALPIKSYGDPNIDSDAPWLLFVVNFKDPLHRQFFQDLIKTYLGTNKILLFDLSPSNDEACQAAERALLHDALCCDVVHVHDTPRNINTLLPEGLRDISFPLGDVTPVLELIENISAILPKEIFSGVVKTTLNNHLQNVLPHRDMKMVTLMMMLLMRYKVQRMVCVLTRNTQRRVIAQTARLFDIPNFEAQVVLGGKMLRHRCPNANLSSVLETWSQRLFVNFFGFPKDRLITGGAARYDEIHQNLDSDEARKNIAAMREVLFGANITAEDTIILFGTQPVEIVDNIFCLERLFDCIKNIPHVKVIIKIHPRELASKKEVYGQVRDRMLSPGQAVILNDKDTYQLMLASDVVLAQNSNILLEAAFLDRRACSLHFHDYDPPVDFIDMNAAIVVRDPDNLADTIRALVETPQGEHEVDAMRKKFIEDNPQLLDRRFNERIIEALNGLQPWSDHIDEMLLDDERRLADFDVARTGKYD